ncbi:MAG: hypothetical protein WBA10_02375 [Elainellaceae cyanobacterium]
MQTIQQRLQHNTFELIAPQPSLGDRVRAALHTLKEFTLNLATSTQEPKITVSQNRVGQSQWTVYDPTNGYRNTFASEDEVQTWIENRYR